MLKKEAIGSTYITEQNDRKVSEAANFSKENFELDASHICRVFTVHKSKSIVVPQARQAELAFSLSRTQYRKWPANYCRTMRSAESSNGVPFCIEKKMCVFVCVQRQLQICSLTAQQLSAGEPSGVEVQEGQSKGEEG